MSQGDWFVYWSIVVVGVLAWLMLDWMGEQ